MLTSSPALGASEAQVTYVRHAHHERVESSYSAVRAGGSVALVDAGLWGFAEKLATERREPAQYGELSAIVSKGPWSLSGGGGSGTDHRYKPSSLVVGDLTRRIAEGRHSLYGGYTKSVYLYDDPTIYEHYRFGWQGFGLHAYLQLLRNYTESRELDRLGSAGGLSATWTRAAARATAGVGASCVARSVSCRGGPREIYMETFVEGRHPLAGAYGASGRAAYILEWTDRSDRSVLVWLGVYASL